MASSPPGVVVPLFVNATHALAPDGWLIMTTDPGGKLLLYPVDGGQPHAGPDLLAGEEPVSWTGDGRAILVRKRAELPRRVYRIDLASGRRELWRELMPRDPAGVIEILGVVPTRDGFFYAFSVLRVPTELYLVDGLGS